MEKSIKTVKSEETKQQLLLSAHRLFHKKGFEATSVREIVEDAGYAKGTFYLYFETKMDALKAIINHLVMEMQHVTYKHLTTLTDKPFDQLNALLDEIALELKKQFCCVHMIHSQEMLGIIMTEGMGNIFIESAIVPIADFIQKGIEQKYFRPVDPLFYAKLIYGMAHNSLETAMFYEYPASIEVVTNELKILIKRIIIAD